MEPGKRIKVTRDESEWRTLLSRHEQSGLTQREFCEREKISLTSFQKWRLRLHKPAESGAGFVELNPEVSSWDMELDLGAGVVLRLRR